MNGYGTLAVFEVLGVPAPQGSHTAVMRGGRPSVIAGSSTTGRAKHRAWRQAVADGARDVAEDTPHDGPLQVGIVFRLPMPASRPRRVRDRGEGPASRKPDIDKIIRATLDGLVDGGLIADDARVFDLHATKLEVVGWTGAEIIVRGVAS